MSTPPVARPFQTPFVGRKQELDLYQQFLGWTTPWVLLITGQGGMGKSTLLRRFVEESPQDIPVLTLDFARPAQLDPFAVLEELCWQIEPYVDAEQLQLFQHTLQEAQLKLAQPTGDLTQEIHLAENATLQGPGMQLSINTVTLELRKHIQQQVTQAFYSLMLTLSCSQLVLLLDTCEWLGELEGLAIRRWLLDEVLLTLHERLQKRQKRCSVVIASRMKLPLPTINTQAIHSYLLPFLDEDAIHDYLTQLGMTDKSLRQHIYRITYGHAFCVEIIGILWQERGNTPFTIADLPVLQEQFNERVLLDFLQEKLYQRLASPFLELTKYTSLLRSFDLPTLEAVYADLLPDNNRAVIFEQFIRYPYIEARSNQHYACHDLWRIIQEARIRAQEPDRWNEYHQRALQHLAQLRPYPADLYYHLLALHEDEGMSRWQNAIQDAYIRDKRDYFQALLLAVQDETLTLTDASRATRAHWQGHFYYYNSEMSSALASYQQALTLFRAVEDRLGEANVLKAMGDVLQFRDERDAALASYQQALTLFRAVESKLGEANVLQAMGLLSTRQNQLPDALKLLTEAYQLYHNIEDNYSQSIALSYRSLVYEATEDCPHAITDMQRAATIAQAIDLRWADEWLQRLESLRQHCNSQ